MRGAAQNQPGRLIILVGNWRTDNMLKNMTIAQRCSNAGPLGKAIPTQRVALAAVLAARLRGLASSLPRLRH